MRTSSIAGILLAGVLMVAQVGCAGVVFREADNGQTKEVYVGTTFSVSLPAPTQYQRPELKGTIIRFLGRHVDDSAKGDIFEFKAEGLGEDEIQVAAATGNDFVLHVRIKSASDGGTVLTHQR